jgi:hypothetical protein
VSLVQQKAKEGEGKGNVEGLKGYDKRWHGGKWKYPV